MAKRQNRKLSPAVRAADREIVIGLLALPDFQPANKSQSPENLRRLLTVSDEAHAEEIRITNARSAARNATIAAEWELHNVVLGIKSLVLGQYGDDHDVANVVGRKRKSDYNSPKRRNGDAQEPGAS